MLAGLVAVNSSAKADVTKTREDRVRDSARSDARPEYSAEHPVVRTHPETGRKMLFVNASYTVGFEDMTEAESRPLLKFLLEHGSRPEFAFRFRWREGSIAFWDNRSTKHVALGDTGPSRRLMRRVQICGDRPG